MDFAEFYQATSPRTLRYAYGLTGDLAQAQDVVQEAYVRAWQRWRRIDGYDDAEAWLRLVVSRLVFDWWRHLRVRRATPLPPPGVVDGPSEDAVLVAAALRKLPDRQRQALALHYLLDVPVAQIATDLDVSEGTVKSWLSRGRERLAALLREVPDGDLPSAESVAATGRRRQRTRVGVAVTAAGLAVLAVIWLATAVLGRHQALPVTPAVRPTASPMAFRPLHRTGSVTLPTAQHRTVAIQDGRAIAASPSGDGVQLVAVDLATAGLAWQPVTVAAGPSDWNLVARSDGIAVVGQRTTFVLDPATGKVRWQHATDGSPLFFPGVVVFPSVERVLGVDIITGSLLWTILGPSPRALGAQRPGDLALPDSGSPTSDMGYSSDSLYVFDGANLIEYAAKTGAPTGRRWNGLQPSVGLRVFDGYLYNLGPHGVTRISLADGTRQVIDLGGPVRWLAPCGDRDICALATAPGGGAAQVVALDGDRIDWRKLTVPEARTIAPYGRRLRLDCYAGPGLVLLDEHGSQTAQWAAGTVVQRLDAANLLVVAQSGALTGVTEDGRQTPLGTVGAGAAVAGAGSLVAAATATELTVYRIA